MDTSAKRKMHEEQLMISSVIHSLGVKIVSETAECK